MVYVTVHFVLQTFKLAFMAKVRGFHSDCLLLWWTYALHHVDLSDNKYLTDFFCYNINQIISLFFASAFVTIRSVESLDCPCVHLST